MRLTTNLPRDQYDAIDALNMSRLKAIAHSPRMYRYALENPKTSSALTLGTAAHVAVLEPERYEEQFCIWGSTTAAGAMSPRRGQYWEAFVANAGKRTILTPEEHSRAQAIAAAVRFDERANQYLGEGDAEVTLEWNLPAPLGGRPAKARVDWITKVGGKPYLVGLKSARDCRHHQFANQAAKLKYHLSWSYYLDGYTAITGRVPQLREIVVDSEAPHSVAVYAIDNDVILQGREEYWELVKTLNECEARDEWPGPVRDEQVLTLPTWAYRSNDDLRDLDLEVSNG